MRENRFQVSHVVSAARYALLCRNYAEFEALYTRFCRSHTAMGMRPEMDHENFWNGILGDKWMGVKYVPEGAAKTELLTMLALRYAFLMQHEDFAAEMKHHLPYSLSLGYALLREDSRLRPGKRVACRDEMEALLTRTYWNVWAGSWNNAYLGFKSYFKTRPSLKNRLGLNGSALLLVVAVIIAIRAQAPHSVVELWSSAAREVMMRLLAENDDWNREDINSFFDCLNVWDAVMNRGQACTLPIMRGSLSLVALSMGSYALMRHVGLNLPVLSMADAVWEIHQRGVHLLSLYGASALINVPGLTAEARARLERIIRESDFAPLYPINRQRFSYGGEKHRISYLVENMLTPSSERLYWDIILDRKNAIQSIEARLVEKKQRPQSTGRAVSSTAVLDSTALSCQEPCDLPIVSLAQAFSSGSVKPAYMVGIADALAGHPRLRLACDRNRRLIQVRKCKPIVRVWVEGVTLRLDMDVQQFHRLEEAEGNIFTIPAYTPRMQALLDYFSNGSVSIDVSRKEELRWLLAVLSRHFEMQGKIPETLMQYTKSAGRLVACVQPDSLGYRIELQVEHLPGSAVYTTPGQGEPVLLVEDADGNLVCVQRDFEAEVAAACELVRSCPSLGHAESAATFCWRMRHKEQQALQIFSELNRRKTYVMWETGSTPIRIYNAGEEDLHLSVQAEKMDWLEIGAELPVDEMQVLELSELFRMYQQRLGRFLPLPHGGYLEVSPELETQIEQLQDVLNNRNNHLVLPVASIPSLVENWKGGLPKAILRREALLHECDDAPVPSALSATLREYQLAGYRWMLARVRAGLGACLADDMGLGKTVQMLALLIERAEQGPSLVIAPLSLCSNWLAEAARFAPSLKMVSFTGSKRDELAELKAGDVVVASYGQVMANEEHFCRVNWNIVTLDEAQAIKNPSSRRAQVVYGLQASARICLTGTPVENSLTDMWSIMHFLNPYLLGPRSRFSRGSAEQAEKLRRLVAPLVLRRTKQEVLPQLPPITEVEIGVELTAEERALYESCRRQAVARIREGGETVALLAELTRLRRLCCHGKLALESFHGASSKLNAMVELVEDLRNAGHRALVFSQFTDVLDLAQEALTAHKFSFLRLDGSMTTARRRKHVEDFQGGEADVFLISLKAGGYGLNLTAADYVILLDPWWNPAVEAQAAGRSHRIGQHKPVTVCRLISRGTVEERVMQMHNAKQALAESVIREGTMPLETLRSILMDS